MCLPLFWEDSKTVFTNLKTKYSFQGEIGKTVDFDYHIPSGRYYLKGGVPQDKSFLEREQPKALIDEITPFPMIKLEDVNTVFEPLNFNNDEENVPF